MLKKEHIYPKLFQEISSGHYRPGEKLPGEIALAEHFGVSRITLRSALDQLQSEGIVEKNGRSGNYVSCSWCGKKFLLIIRGSHDVTAVTEHYIATSLRYELTPGGHSLEMLNINSLKETNVEDWNFMLQNNHISGVFLMADLIAGEEKLYDLLNNSSVPVIKLLHSSNRSGYRFPEISNARGGKTFMDGVRCLAEAGHKRICTVFSDTQGVAGQRGVTLADYKEFLANCGLCNDDELILHTSVEQTAAAVRKVLLSLEPPTAFMCFCDTRALEVYSAVNKLGMHIPQQISVMGFCGYSERLFAIPKLGVVNFHYDRICSEAVKMMLDSKTWFGEGMENISVVIPHTVEPNGSVAPVQTYQTSPVPLCWNNPCVFPEPSHASYKK